MSDCKQMDYEKNERELLANSFYKEYEFFVINIGSHPCAYVRLKKNGNYYEEPIIDVHGGITYKEHFLWINDEEFITDNVGFIGWDYGHCFDYMSFYKKNSKYHEIEDNYKKWTTEEMIKDCIKVIDQLIVLDKEEVEEDE